MSINMGHTKKTDPVLLAKYIFLVLLNVGQILGQCTFGSSWVNLSPVVIDLSDRNTLTGAGYETNKVKYGSIAGNLPDDIPCAETTDVDGTTIKIAREDFSEANKHLCEAAIVGANNNAILYQRTAISGTAVTTAQCVSPYNTYTVGFSLASSGATGADAVINHLKTLNGPSLLADGTWDTEVNSDSGALCSDATSKTTTSGNKLQLQSICGSGSVDILKTELTVIDTWEPEDKDTHGSIALLMDQTYPTASGARVFCARFKIGADKTEIAIDVADPGVAQCSRDMKATESLSGVVKLTLATVPTTTTSTTTTSTTTPTTSTSTTSTSTASTSTTTSTTTGQSQDTTSSSTQTDSTKTSTSTTLSVSSSTSGSTASTASTATSTTAGGTFSGDAEHVEFPFYNNYAVVDANGKASLLDELKQQLATKAGVTPDRIKDLDVSKDPEDPEGKRILTSFNIAPGAVGEPTPKQAAENLKTKIDAKEDYTAPDSTILKPYPTNYNHYNANGPCKNKPCQNGGLCSDAAGGSYTCRGGSGDTGDTDGLPSRTILIILLCVLAALIFLTVLVSVAICNCRNKSSPPRRSADYDNGSLIGPSWKADYM